MSELEGAESVVVRSLEVAFCLFESKSLRVPAGSVFCIVVNSSSCTPRLAESLEVEETDARSGPPTSASGIVSDS
jgi:hypothetical protein